MQLFYAPDITLPEYLMNEEESRHALKVLRLEVGDELDATDGRGNMHHCRITGIEHRRCRIEVLSTITEFERRNYRLTMAVAPTKNIDRYEWFLEKATEIGCDEFVAIECDHSERRTVKAEREERVITAAVKQSLKAYHPTFEAMVPFAEFIARPCSGRRFIAHCGTAIGTKHYLAATLRKGEDVTILIGPEGDFSAEEIQAAVACGFEEITLGTQRFRTETAATVATDMVAIVNSLE